MFSHIKAAHVREPNEELYRTCLLTQKPSLFNNDFLVRRHATPTGVRTLFRLLHGPVGGYSRPNRTHTPLLNWRGDALGLAGGWGGMEGLASYVFPVEVAACVVASRTRRPRRCCKIALIIGANGACIYQADGRMPPTHGAHGDLFRHLM